MRHDVTFPLYVEVDEIYNLACPASPIHYQFDPVQTTKTSVHGAINMLGLAKRLQGHDLPGLDLGSLRRPDGASAARRSIGAMSIRSARAPATTRASAAPRRCSSIITASTGMRIKVARIFNTYGPRMHPNDGRVVSNFIVQALQGRDITIYGDGSQTRSFCYVDDLDRGLHALDGHARTTVTGPINLGNPGEFTMRELAELVIDVTGSKSRMIFEPLPIDDPKQRQPDITFARNELGWEPKIQLRTGLEQTARYFEGILATKAK